jgi:hypothetical protein
MVFLRASIARLAATACLLALASGPWLQCAGWQAAPADRMACCADDGQCPMDDNAVHAGHAAPATQADADRCCAMSESDNVPQAPAARVVLAAILVQLTGPSATFAVDRDSRDRLRSRDQIPASPVPRHLLLSVFLI